MKLSDIDKNKMQEAFKVPETYFDNFPILIEQKIYQKKTALLKTVHLRPWIIASSFAASIALILTIYIQRPKPIESKIEIALNKNDIFEIIIKDAELYGISEDLIYDELSKDLISDNSKKTTINNKKVELSKDDIIDYLIEEDPNIAE
ncbi:MAG: hypothetical protein WCK02_06945 [Bacteroidota bacterium]